MNREDAKALRREGFKTEGDAVATGIMNSAYAVRTQLGSGLLEGIYKVCLAPELRQRGLQIERQVAFPVLYDGMEIESGLRLDPVLEQRVVVEINLVESILPVPKARVTTYVKLYRLELGFLINFNVALIKDSLRRIVSPLPSSRRAFAV